MFDTLYKKDSKGKIRLWSVDVIDYVDHSIIRVTHGEEYGQKQVRETRIEEGKNIGKSNETTHYEQALKEAKSKYDKQKDKGYSTDPDQFLFRPMLAHRFDKHPHKVSYECFLQAKLDGMRSCIYNEGGEWKIQSRNGKPIVILPHIQEVIHDSNLPKDWILDGELYVHGWSFQKLIGAVKRDTPNEDTKHVQFHWYDLCLNDDSTYLHRYVNHIQPSFRKINSELIQSVDTAITSSEHGLFLIHKEFLRKGYEGSMVRNYDGKYKIDGRSYDLLKVKDFKDDEYKIVGVKEDKEGGAVIECVTEDGKEFSVRPEGTLEYRQNLLERGIIGHNLTVRFFEYTDDGVPRFPVGVCIRDYE